MEDPSLPIRPFESQSIERDVAENCDPGRRSCQSPPCGFLGADKLDISKSTPNEACVVRRFPSVLGVAGGGDVEEDAPSSASCDAFFGVCHQWAIEDFQSAGNWYAAGAVMEGRRPL